MLSDRQLANLIALEKACRRNARALANEAGSLLSQSAARAFFLALTGHEELGKAQLVADFRSGHIAESVLTDSFRNHAAKFAYLQRALCVPSTSSSDVQVAFNREEGDFGKDSREAVLYVDMASDFAPVEPSSRITVELAGKAIDALNGELSGMNYMDLLGGIDSATLLKTTKRTEPA